MTGFMDLYLAAIADPSATPKSRFDLELNLRWIGLHFWRTFGHYMPARMCLSPSSVIKLAEPQINSSDLLGTHKKVRRVFEQEANTAFRPDALPIHLHPFLRYNRLTDEEAGQQLMWHYSHTATADSSRLLEELNSYKDCLLKDILKARQELRIDYEHPVIRQIIVTALYTKTIMFILLLRNSNAHVTLELDNLNRMHGIPENLLRENPHIAGSIQTDLLPAVLEQTRRRHPEIANQPAFPAVPHQYLTPVSFTHTVDCISAEDINNAREEAKVERKRRRIAQIASVLTPYLGQQPPLPQTTEQAAVYQVSHTRTQIRQALANHASDRLIEQIMQKIRRFEMGHIKAAPLREASNFFRIRLGDLRIILCHTGNGIFEIDSIGPRDKVYEDK